MGCNREGWKKRCADKALHGMPEHRPRCCSFSSDGWFVTNEAQKTAPGEEHEEHHEEELHQHRGEPRQAEKAQIGSDDRQNQKGDGPPEHTEPHVPRAPRQNVPPFAPFPRRNLRRDHISVFSITENGFRGAEDAREDHGEQGEHGVFRLRLGDAQARFQLERNPAKWKPVRRKIARQTKESRAWFDSIRADHALGPV